MQDTKDDTEKTLSLGTIPIEKVSVRPQRLSMIIWGEAGCGKTSLAATAPGKKLILNFDPDGTTSITGEDNIDVADFTNVAPATLKEMIKRKEDPLKLKSVIDKYDTFIIDSLTNLAQLSLEQGVADTKGATMERPSPGAYGVRNALSLQAIRNTLRFTAKHNKNVIFIAHEGTPVTNDDGLVLHITLMLGGQLPQQSAVDISEVWAMRDDGKKRHIAIRPCRSRKPMKTRMFNVTSSPEFVWDYDQQKKTGFTLAKTYQAWVDGGNKKLSPPAK